MANLSSSSPHIDAAAAVSAPMRIVAENVPDWEKLPLAVPCGRCGADLHSLTEPVCHSCGLEFVWDEVLPVEQLCCRFCSYHLMGLTERRCPECGERFDWAEVLSAARACLWTNNNLFEQQWSRKPFSSLFRSWRLAAFRPGKLWSKYSLQDEPQILPLLLFALMQWAVFAFGWQALAPLVTRAMNYFSGLEGSAIQFSYFFRGGQGPRSLPMFVGLWYGVTFICFQLYVQSKHLYRVRWQQILRVYVHSTAFAAWAMVLWLVVEAGIDLTLLLIPTIRPQINNNLYLNAGRIVLWLAILVTWLSIWLGYRRYLRVPHGWAVAGLSLWLAYLLTQLLQLYLPDVLIRLR